VLKIRLELCLFPGLLTITKIRTTFKYKHQFLLRKKNQAAFRRKRHGLERGRSIPAEKLEIDAISLASWKNEKSE
jgi:hypothetical protein